MCEINDVIKFKSKSKYKEQLDRRKIAISIYGKSAKYKNSFRRKLKDELSKEFICHFPEDFEYVNLRSETSKKLNNHFKAAERISIIESDFIVFDMRDQNQTALWPEIQDLCRWWDDDFKHSLKERFIIIYDATIPYLVNNDEISRREELFFKTKDVNGIIEHVNKLGKSKLTDKFYRINTKLFVHSLGIKSEELSFDFDSLMNELKELIENISKTNYFDIGEIEIDDDFAMQFLYDSNYFHKHSGNKYIPGPRFLEMVGRLNYLIPISSGVIYENFPKISLDYFINEILAKVLIHNLSDIRKKHNGKYVTSALAKIFIRHYKDVILKNLSKKKYLYSTAYIKGKGAYKNASIHLDCKSAINIDIKNFYPTFKVSNDHISDILKGVEGQQFTILKKMFFEENLILKAGVPLANEIMNFVMDDFDNDVVSRISKKFTYSRYCDDITISSKDIMIKNDIDQIYEIFKNLFVGMDLVMKFFKVKYNHEDNSKCNLFVTGYKVNHARPYLPNKKLKKVLKNFDEKMRSHASGNFISTDFFSYSFGMIKKFFKFNALDFHKWSEKFDVLHLEIAKLILENPGTSEKDRKEVEKWIK